MDVIRLIRILLKRVKILVLIPILAMLMTYFLTLKMENVYKAQAQIAAGIVDESKITIEDKADLQSSFLIQTKFSNIIELIRCKQVVDQVSMQLMLHDLTKEHAFRQHSKLFEGMNEQAKSNARKKLAEKIDQQQSLSAYLPDEVGIIKLIKSMGYDDASIQKKLKVERLGTSDFIEISYESDSGDMAAFVPNTVCQEFLRFYKTVKSEQNTNSVDFWERLARQKKAELDSVVDVLKNFKLQHQIINLYEQTKSLVNQISTLELQREEENKQIPSLQAALIEIDKKFSPKQKEYLESKLEPYQEKVSELKRKIENVNQRYIESGFSSTTLRDSLNVLRGAMYNAVQNISDNFIMDPNVSRQDLVTKKIGFELDLEIAKKGVVSMDKERARLQKIVDSFTPCDATISSYEREISVLAEAYLVILNKLTLAKFANEASGEGIRITEGALVPDGPEASKKLLLIILSAVISFILCIILILVFEYLDLTVKTPRQFVKLSGLDLLGYFNLLEKHSLDLGAMFSTSNSDPETRIFKNLLQAVRAEVTQSLQDKKVILITGSNTGEGKSLVLLSLAFSYKITGKKILLLDTNFKNTSLTKQLNAKPLLESAVQAKIRFEEAITPTALTGIDIIGADGTIGSPDEIAGPEAFAAFISAAASNYDIVLLEGPSMSKYADSKELISVADRVVVIFSANRTIEQSDKDVFSYLKNLGDKFSGAILNKVLPENLEQSYGEIQKNRTKIRVRVKQLLKRNFSKN
jgi:uncharacterized protein involved in exopolysaccharide biosynthesis/Mrp family chromosome partitioning ATPase